MGVFRECRGECEEEEAEQVQPLRRAVVGHRRSSRLHIGFDPGREVQKKYGKCTKINDPANSVWREKCAVFHANTMRVKDAKKAAKFDHAAVG